MGGIHLREFNLVSVFVCLCHAQSIGHRMHFAVRVCVALTSHCSVRGLSYHLTLSKMRFASHLTKSVRLFNQIVGIFRGR